MQQYYIVHRTNDNNPNELMHYGVPGMKWGVRRALRGNKANVKLTAKALRYDQKAAKRNLRAERIHAKEDLGGYNRTVAKAAKYKLKATTLAKRANKTDSEYKRAKLERKSANMKYKSSKLNMKADQISKSTPYSSKALKYVRKADKMAMKADKARKKIAKNKAYTEKMKRKISTLTPEELNGGYSFVNELLK